MNAVIWKSARVALSPILALVLMLTTAAKAETPVPPVGQPAPALQALDLKTGQPASLSTYAGKVIVLAFLDPTCEFCRAEAPYLQKGWNKYKKKNVAVVAVMMSIPPDPTKLAQAFAKKYHFSFPVMLDTPDNAAAQSWGVWAHPFNAVIDQKGVLQYISPGYEGSRVDKLVKQLISRR